MSRIAEAFSGRKSPAFIGFMVAGDPDPDAAVRIAQTMIDAGVDILELGVPFSDPGADGPAIERAHERALQAGTTPDRVFGMVRAIRTHSNVPIVLFTYYNPVYRRGAERFFADAADAGADGVLVVDLPIEEADLLAPAAACAGIDRIFLIAPTTSEERRKRIVDSASGFIYLISLEGVTGVRDDLPPGVAASIRSIQTLSPLPVAVGFGISKPDHVRALCDAGADAVVVGSALTQVIEEHMGDEEAMLRKLHGLISELCAARDGYPGAGGSDGEESRVPG